LGAIALTNQVTSDESPSPNLVSLGFPPAPSGQEKITGGTGGGGTRTGGNACLTDGPASALIPFTPTDQVPVTVDPNPSLFLYVPETQAKQAEFVVMDIRGDYVYSQKLKLSGKSGIVKVSLPETNQKGEALSLEQGKIYLWEFAIVCDPNDRSGDVYAWGIFNRSELDQKINDSLSKQQNPLEKAKIYAENRLWYETLEQVAEVKDTQPEEWKELLNSIGIAENEIIEAPLIKLDVDQ
jgi:hypothetical protein